jgi:hypothetical protein
LKVNPDRPDPTAKDDYLAQFPERQRGPVGNLFLRPIRNGITDPAAIVEAVRRDLLSRLQQSRDEPEGRKKVLAVLQTLDQPEARATAAWYVSYEKLPPAAKATLKAQRAEAGIRAWMETQPPTERQLNYLRRLGYDGPVENRARASELIDRLVKGGRP